MSGRKGRVDRPGRSRSAGSLGRRARTRSGDRLLIVCEGLKTERIYFEALCAAHKLHAVDVRIVPVGGAPITVVDTALAIAAEQRREAGKGGDPPFDEVWCVFDTEIPHDNASPYRALDKARARGLSLAVSNPSFEFWYLLHFTFTTRGFYTSNQVIEVLKQDHIAGYDKATDYWELLGPLTATAIANAQRIATDEEPYPQPSTTAYQLVEKVLTLVRR